ncbi:hypothetical protein LINPERPRIM_LOCUS1141 [Linum perenne]
MEAALPSLPAKLSVPMYYVPPLNIIKFGCNTMLSGNIGAGKTSFGEVVGCQQNLTELTKLTILLSFLLFFVFDIRLAIIVKELKGLAMELYLPLIVQSNEPKLSFQKIRQYMNDLNCNF